jgi:hypothetical protein
MTDQEIQKLRDAIENTLGNMKSDIRKSKLKVFGKALLSLVIVAGGVAVSVIFPNPITIGVLGGAATLIAGNNGVLSKTKKIKEKEKKKSKEEVKNINIEQNNRKWTKNIQSIISQQKNVPNIYPDLRQS